MGRVLWAVVWLVFIAVAANIAAMILSFAVFWPDSFVKSEIDDLGIIGWAIILGFVRIYMQDLVAMGGIVALTKPSSRTVALRFLAALAICALTVAYCMAIVYFGLVLPGIKTPLFVVFNIWILSMFPMLFLMTYALRGVYYIEHEQKEDRRRRASTNQDRRTKSFSIKREVDKKPLIHDEWTANGQVNQYLTNQMENTPLINDIGSISNDQVIQELENKVDKKPLIADIGWTVNGKVNQDQANGVGKTPLDIGWIDDLDDKV